jgi:hypothetical protein
MNIYLADLIERIRSQPPLVRAFIYIMLFGLALICIDSAVDFVGGFARGFSDSINR